MKWIFFLQYIVKRKQIMKKRIQKSKRKIYPYNIIEHIKKIKSFSGIVRTANKYNDNLDKIKENTQYLEKDSNIMQRIYHIKNDINKIMVCPICNKSNLIWDKKYNEYRNWCKNNECKKSYMLLHRDPEKEIIRINKIKETKSKWTQEHRDEITKKIKETLIENYGVDSYAKTQQFKDGMVENYGYISHFSLKEVRDKAKNTLIERTGYDHNFKIPEVKE